MGHNDLVNSRVRVADSGTVADGIERMLAGSGTILRLADPNRTPDPLDEDGIPEGFTGVLVSTSGSTGTPKTVMLSREALIAAAQAGIDRLGGPGSWANPLPGWYVAGLMTRVRALVGGKPYAEVSPHLENLPVAEGRAYISLVPAQLHRCLSDDEICRVLTSYSAVLIGGAHLDESLHTRAEQAGMRIVTTYGMSETCGGVVYDGIPLDGIDVSLNPDPLDRKEMLFPGVECRPMHTLGVENRTYDNPRPDETTTLPGEGRIRISGPTVFEGYLGDPELTAWVRDGNSFLTNDRGRIVDGRLRVLGRVDDVVQSGGTNVDLSEIQHLLDKEFPHQVACFAQPDPVWGSTVVVASAGPTLDEIWTQLEPHLESAAKPRGILIVDALPRTSSGKIDREQVVRMWRNSGERA